MRGLLATAVVLVASEAHAEKTWSEAIALEVGFHFVPVANDLALTAGVALRFDDVHELWVRGGYIPVGADRGYGLGVGGYRAVLRPHNVVRPLVGAVFGGLPAQCFWDANGNPDCKDKVLFIFAAQGGVRFEPVPWLGLSAVLSFGIDSYPNPFGMIEIGVSFALPLS